MKIKIIPKYFLDISVIITFFLLILIMFRFGANFQEMMLLKEY